MPLLSTLNKGFTLLEMLLAAALLTILAGAGLVTGIRSYQQYLFRADVNTAVALLRSARGSAMNNMSQTSHGVYFGEVGTLVLFAGPSYAARTPSADLRVKIHSATSVNGLAELVFAPLSGRTSGGSITLSNTSKSSTITINYEGGIDW